MSLWQTGDILGPTNLNAHGASATTLAGFSTNTLTPESGSTISLVGGLLGKSIDSGGAEWNAAAFGVCMDGGTDNSAALQAAFSAVTNSPTGGTLRFPPGVANHSQPLTIIGMTDKQMKLKGSGGVRGSGLQYTGSGGTALTWGSLTINNNYPEIEDLTIEASNSSNTACALALLRPSQWALKSVLIQNFGGVAGGTGLYLKGTGTGQHAYQGKVTGLTVAVTARPLYLEDADENNFYGCQLACPAGSTSALTALEIKQGRNNRFWGLTVGGDNSNLTARLNYTGVLLSNPSTGDNAGNQFYGLVAEGFDSGISIGSNVTNTWVENYNSSINSVDIRDAGLNTTLIENGNLAVPIRQHISGTPAGPSYAFRSEGSLGWYRSGTSTLALSYGTFNLRNAALSLRTTASSASASNLTQGEICLVAVSATSAQLAFKSGNTVYVFNAIQATP